MEKEGIDIPNKTIEHIQEIYNSDIRSMINYMQLHQNYNSIDWNRSIINTDVLISIHAHFLDPHYKKSDMLFYIHEMSIQYNIDKVAILNKYFNYIIRHVIKDDFGLSQFISILPDIIHNANIKIEDTLETIHQFFFTHKNKIEMI
jgi:hypothetical protein